MGRRGHRPADAGVPQRDPLSGGAWVGSVVQDVSMDAGGRAVRVSVKTIRAVAILVLSLFTILGLAAWVSFSSGQSFGSEGFGFLQGLGAMLWVALVAAPYSVIHFID